MLYLLPIWGAFLFFIGRVIYTWLNETIEDNYNTYNKQDYMSIKMSESEEMEMFRNLFIDLDLQKEAYKLVGDDIAIIAPDHVYDLGFTYVYPRDTQWLRGNNMLDLYLVWLYCAKKGKICPSCACSRYRYSFMLDDTNDTSGIYLERYIRALKLVEKYIQEKYPDQKIYYLGKTRDINGMVTGNMLWDAEITKSEHLRNEKLIRLW